MAAADPTGKPARPVEPGEMASGIDPATARFKANASATVEDMKEELSAMRDDVNTLSQQVVDLLQAKGGAAYRRAKRDFNEKTGDAQEALADVRDTFAEAIEESVQQRPVATLALAVGVGFVLGAIWRR